MIHAGTGDDLAWGNLFGDKDNDVLDGGGGSDFGDGGAGTDICINVEFTMSCS